MAEARRRGERGDRRYFRHMRFVGGSLQDRMDATRVVLPQSTPYLRRVQAFDAEMRCRSSPLSRPLKVRVWAVLTSDQNHYCLMIYILYRHRTGGDGTPL